MASSIIPPILPCRMCNALLNANEAASHPCFGNRDVFSDGQFLFTMGEEETENYEPEPCSSGLQTQVQHANPDEDRFEWGRNAIKALLAAFKEEQEEGQEYGKIREKVWKKVAEEVTKTTGQVPTAMQCKSKMLSLKRTYKNKRDHNAKSGNNKVTWEYMEAMDELFSKKPYMTPVRTLESEAPAKPRKEEPEEAEEPVAPAKKRKTKAGQKSELAQLSDTLKNIHEGRMTAHKERMERQDKFINLFNKYLGD